MTTIEMIDKRFKIISTFELQTRDQLNWFILQLERMLMYYQFSYFSQMIENRSIYCLFEKLISKAQWADIDNNGKMRKLKEIDTTISFLKKIFFALRRECLRCFHRLSFKLIFSHLIAAQITNRLADVYLFAFY